jgi:hypothetical protein
MSHQIERLADGTAAFASARVPAWHQLGTLTTDAMTATEVITTARLSGWNVRKIDVVGRELVSDAITGAAYDTIDAPDKAMTVRTNPVTGATDYLGVVGRDYTPVQNEACAELLDLLIDASGAHFESAGSLRAPTRLPTHTAEHGVLPPTRPWASHGDLLAVATAHRLARAGSLRWYEPRRPARRRHRAPGRRRGRPRHRPGRPRPGLRRAARLPRAPARRQRSRPTPVRAPTHRERTPGRRPRPSRCRRRRRAGRVARRRTPQAVPDRRALRT